MPPEVSVVVPCRNESDTIVPLLEAIVGQTLRPRQILVVDDGSTDGTANVVDAWARAHAMSQVTVVPGGGRGAAAAMNVGIASADGDVIVRLDGHCVPDSHYIQRSLEALAKPDSGVVGGVWRITAGSETRTARGIAAALAHPFASGGAAYRAVPPAGERRIREVDTVPFGSFSRSVWEAVGGFDESLVRNQDYEFNHRVRLSGRKVYLDPAIVSVYKARSTFGALARQYFDYGSWKVVMLRKFPASIRLRQMIPLLLVPALGLLAAWAIATRSALPLALLAAYLVLNLAGATQAALRAGDARLIPAATAALLILQNAWSAGAWSRLLAGPRSNRT